MAALRSGRQVRIIGGRTVNMWRPFHSLLKFWTPRRSTYGVRSCCSSQSGRHLPNCMASVPAAFPNLDATKLGRWRPFCSASPIWTPLTQSHGVHSAQLPRFGRHPLNHTASNFAALLKLDATQPGRWRPLRTASQIWTPPTQSHGVRSAQLLQSGRHTHNHTASIPHNFHDLDASHSVTWRPFLLLSLIWTPPNSDAGVRSCCSSQSGRLPHSPLASIPLSFSNLDASHTVT